jgi:cytochrome c556
MTKGWIVPAFALLVCAAPGIAEEDFDPEPIIEGRQAALRDIGAAFKAISDELKAPTPVLATIRSNTRQIEDLMKQQHFWFPPGTGPESEIETLAKPEIWQRPAEFKKAQTAFSEAAQQLTRAAEGSDVSAMRSQWRELGKTCKGCHDTFREEED